MKLTTKKIIGRIVMGGCGRSGLINLKNNFKSSLVEEIRIVKNEFPYNFSHGIEHHVMWASQIPPQSTNHPFIQSRFPSSQYEVLMFENVKANKSVKSVAHVHLIVRTRDSPW